MIQIFFGERNLPGVYSATAAQIVHVSTVVVIVVMIKLDDNAAVLLYWKILQVGDDH